MKLRFQEISPHFIEFYEVLEDFTDIQILNYTTLIFSIQKKNVYTNSGKVNILF